MTYAYDGEDNITGITDVVTPANNQLFRYDPVERLSRVDLSTGTNRRDDYVFDANGNRIRVEHRATTTTVTPTSTDTYTRTPGTNRLASIATTAGTRTESYDARGNLSAESRPGSIAVTTSYDGFARLTAYTRTGQSALAMQYNGLDQRVMLTRGTTVRRMVQDRDGRLLGEYGTAGTQIFTEYIWLLPETSDGAQTFGGDDGTGGWTPLAVVTAPGNTTQTLLFLRSSHLGVPVGSTNATGTNTAIANGTTLLGFPGQQQTLSDLYYNQYRDYDTVTGRYIQADPLGLDGDINPYAYAGGNPVRFSDAWGLACSINGCWLTLREKQFADDGNYRDYYREACMGGDNYACAAGEVANDVGLGAHFTNWRLRNDLRGRGYSEPECDQRMEQIRVGLARAHAYLLRDATPLNPRILRGAQIAWFHYHVFRNAGAGNVFGGNIPGSNYFFEWCARPSCIP